MSNTGIKSNLLGLENLDFFNKQEISHAVPYFLELKAIQICWDIDVEQDSIAA
tara:strand:+ start:1295 stop:1453 length:159 start_codon:yes stop_codon:yes gene_type:complete